MLSVTEFYEAATAAGMTESATWTPAGGAAVALDVVFANDYNEIYQMEGNRPMLRAPSALLPGVAQGDAVTVNGTNYVVAAIHRDTPNVDETTLMLSKA